MTDNFREKALQQAVLRIKVSRQECVHAIARCGIHFSHHDVCGKRTAVQRPLERDVIKVDGDGVDMMDGANDVFDSSRLFAEKGKQFFQIGLGDELGL